MSSAIWTECAGASNLGLLRLSPWRLVEAQHLVSTRKLVDSLEEQAVLEELIEASKPPDGFGGRLHSLLATPFRYPPLRHGSRFGATHEPGIWYGSVTHRTLFAEAAYYRLLFLDGTSADLDIVSTWHTAFTVRVRTDRGVDLTDAAFRFHRRSIASPVDYAVSQALGRAMRASGVEAFRYPSARDDQGGENVGVLAPGAFGAARPRSQQAWHCSASRDRVEFTRHDFMVSSAYAYRRAAFLVGGRLPAPAL